MNTRAQSRPQHRRLAPAVLLAGLIMVPTVAAADTAPADTVAPAGSLLRQLQSEDEAFFPEELLRGNPVFTDSVVTRLDSLGYKGFEHEQGLNSHRFDLGFGIAESLFDYNRTEGLVLGPAMTVEPRGPLGPSLRLQGAYAVGSEEFRHHESIRVPILDRRKMEMNAEVFYRDRVEPYGASRPTANALRTLIGAADDRDYLRRRGGGAGLRLSTGNLDAALDYEAARESNIGVHEDFSLLGRVPRKNSPIEAGIDRAARAGIALGSLSGGWWRIEASHRVAGGSLGGDFTYNRSAAGLGLRRYLGRQEFYLDLTGVRTGGAAPTQQMADLGGLGSVRGFDRRTHVGKASLSARLEYHIPYDFLEASGIPLLRDTHLQFVPWTDAGRVWDGDSNQWLTSAGLGVQYFIGPFERFTYIRFDAAAPLGPDRPSDTRFYLRFARALF